MTFPKGDKDMTIALGCDHAGLELKNEIIAHLEANGTQTIDCGTYTKESCDYPVFAEAVAEKVTSKKADLGILVCGTGIGMSMAANKIKGIRAAALSDCFTAEATRRHNNANVLCLGQRAIGAGLALKLVDIFISTPFDGGRHARRVDLITKLENR